MNLTEERHKLQIRICNWRIGADPCAVKADSSVLRREQEGYTGEIVTHLMRSLVQGARGRAHEHERNRWLSASRREVWQNSPSSVRHRIAWQMESRLYHWRNEN